MHDCPFSPSPAQCLTSPGSLTMHPYIDIIYIDITYTMHGLIRTCLITLSTHYIYVQFIAAPLTRSYIVSRYIAIIPIGRFYVNVSKYRAGVHSSALAGAMTQLGFQDRLGRGRRHLTFNFIERLRQRMQSASLS